MFAAHIHITDPDVFHSLTERNKPSLNFWLWHGAGWYPIAAHRDRGLIQKLAEAWSRFGRTRVVAS